MQKLKAGNLSKKIVVFLTGLFIMAFGVALSVKADLGVSPISCIPYIYSLKLASSMGSLTISTNVLFIVAQILLLRRQYHWIQLLQLPAVIIFGYFIDLALYLISDLNVPSYGWRIFCCLLGCVVLGFGVFLEVKSALTYLPGEGLVAAISKIFRQKFGNVKIGFDTSLVVLGILSSLLLMQRLQGVREGTVVAALLVGYLVKFFNSKLPMLERWLEKASPR